MRTLALLAVAATLPAQAPRTAPEQSGHARTSTHAEVVAFVEQLAKLPHADRLVAGSLGATTEERDLVTVLAADPPVATASAEACGARLRVLVCGNIHGGEVEGKEAVQMLLRELALGEHEDLLRELVVLFVPVFNADGNDAFAPGQRRGQNGPIPIGKRPNANALDLNRDFVKAESPEVRALLGAFRRFDPHLFMDLHTTNGSHHGYHLTYAPSLSANVDPVLDRYARDALLPQVTTAMAEKHGFRAFHYGNFGRGDSKRWTTYDHRPRFGTNYVGLRNRLAVLSEAYSYLPFDQRIAVSRAFVLENLLFAAAQRAAIQTLCTDADARAEDPAQPMTFGSATELAPPRTGEILVGGVERVQDEHGIRLVAKPDVRAEAMPIQDAFRATRHRPLPHAWLVVAPSAEVVATLARHGLELRVVPAPLTVRGEVFKPARIQRQRRRFQGHRPITLAGSLALEDVDCPPGSLVVAARQPLARLAAQLLEAESEDSLAVWNAFDTSLDREDGLRYPVVRLSEPLAPDAATPVADLTVDGVLRLRVSATGEGAERVVRYRIGAARAADTGTLPAVLRTTATALAVTADLPTLVLEVASDSSYGDVAATIEACADAGFRKIEVAR